jgi:hypothetical protein
VIGADPGEVLDENVGREFRHQFQILNKKPRSIDTENHRSAIFQAPSQGATVNNMI